MPAIPFTGNYEDLSTDRGFQFKFYCEKCRNGYMSSFKTSAAGVIGSAARAAGSLFGGFFGNVADSSYEVQRAVGGSAHDSALKDAVAEISPIFKQCTRCGQWVCKPVCWNEKAGLCEGCAPDLDEEMASAQAEAAREQIQAKAREVDWTKSRDVAQVSGAVCRECGAKTQGAKFCPECGASLSPKRKCAGCGHEAEGSAAKFCPECGQKY
ncbi:MAG TPA: zinc ribbon domain-containing protein [Thermoanaerobaculia bacterium]|nr:zinc ribbon domain-containing protein [Thermoanaerobaculia bacterium]